MNNFIRSTDFKNVKNTELPIVYPKTMLKSSPYIFNDQMEKKLVISASGIVNKVLISKLYHVWYFFKNGIFSKTVL